MRYALWNVIGVAPRLLSPAWRSRATEEQERIGWEVAVRIERIIATVHDEAHKRRVEEVMRSSLRGQRPLLPHDSSEPEFLHIYPIV